MIFYRVLNNKLYSIDDVEKLGFDNDNNLRIPDEYLAKQQFTAMRMCHGIGDWGIISAMPRLLKEKYPNSSIYIPSHKFLDRLFGYNKQHEVVYTIFKNNPYIIFKDYMLGDIFHDHYRIYNSNDNIPLLNQILKFWQFENINNLDILPEIYFTEEEKKLGNEVIGNNKEFGALLISERFGTQKGKHCEKTLQNETEKITTLLKNNDIPYFYWTYKPIEETPFNFIDKVLDMRHIDMRLQLYIRSKAVLNIGNQCGVLDCLPRYTKVYEVQRQFPLAHNFGNEINYL